MIDEYGNNVNFISKFPVKGACVQNEDGSYSIFIKAELSWEEQIITYIHELKHIKNHDFEKFNVQEIEAEAHA